MNLHLVACPSPRQARPHDAYHVLDYSELCGQQIKALLSYGWRCGPLLAFLTNAHPISPPPMPSPSFYPFQLPKLSTLAYEGPRDRRQTGLDITHALQQLLEAATAPATTAATTAAGAAAAQGSGSDSSTSSLPQQPSQQLGCQQVLSGSARGVGLTVLECVAGSLPDVLMEVVGGLRGLVRLKLSSTTALHMAPVSNLTALTAITMTVGGGPGVGQNAGLG